MIDLFPLYLVLCEAHYCFVFYCHRARAYRAKEYMVVSVVKCSTATRSARPRDFRSGESWKEMEFSLRANESLFLGDLSISALVGAASHLDPRKARVGF